MDNKKTITGWLSQQNPWVFSLYCILAAFLTYCSMYAFRKPFTAAEFASLHLWGIDYKIVLIITQVLGYMLSKFLGIKVVSEMEAPRRIRAVLTLIGISWIALLFLAIIPYPYNFFTLFFNGLPLGMIWGIVFSFLEGRRATELLGAGMSSSFIVSSGLVKSVGKYLIEIKGIPEFWMPFLTGLIFVPLLMVGVWMLAQIPPPSEEDEAERTERVPMDKASRRYFWGQFSLGIVLVVLIYVALTIFRDLRDNFAVELWAALGYANQPEVLALAEIPIAISVLVIIGLMMFIQNNHRAFMINLGIIILGGGTVLLTTWLFNQNMLDPALWMILSGFGMYLSYISYHTMLFERWIALFRIKSNLGYLMYVADAFGYLGSVGILLFRNFGASDLSWLKFFNITAYSMAIVTLILGGMAILYFYHKYRSRMEMPNATAPMIPQNPLPTHNTNLS